MRMQVLLISCGLLLLSAASAKAAALNDYIMCDHESGEDARCVDKALCNLPARPIDVGTIVEPVEGGCTNVQICCPESEINLIPESAALVTRPVGCGYSTYSYSSASKPRDLASDYDYANYGEFPWMVALLKKNVSDVEFHDAYIGGGTLIDASVVLTVAHKVDEISASNLKVRAGEWDTTTEGEIYRHQERNVKKIIIHEEFQKLNAHYDFALVILEKPLDLDNAPHIGVACLERSLPPPGTQCYSMGWGEDAKSSLRGENKYSDILKKVSLPLVDGGICRNEYRNTELGPTYKLHKTLTCAGGVPNVDTCVGDGGSSLVCPIPDKEYIRYSVVGMVVYGLGCGRNIPGVYAKIPEAFEWVQTKMDSEGFTTMAFRRS